MNPRRGGSAMPRCFLGERLSLARKPCAVRVDDLVDGWPVQRQLRANTLTDKPADAVDEPIEFLCVMGAVPDNCGLSPIFTWLRCFREGDKGEDSHEFQTFRCKRLSSREKPSSK